MSGNVVVLGASGGIGREIVARLIERNHDVIAVARDAGRLQTLKERVKAPERVTPLAQPIATEQDGVALAASICELHRPVTAVVSALRDKVQSARLLDRSADDLLRAVGQDVVANFVAAKHLLPLLAEAEPEGGRYLVLSGPMALCAWSGYAHVSIAASALHMLTRALREEAKELPVVVQQLQIGTPVRTETNERCACPDWIGADEVARRVVELVERRDSNVPVVELGAYRAARRVVPAFSARSFT